MAKKKGSAKKSASGADPEAPPIDFETALAEVEKIVRNLESGELGLSDSLAQYEQGIEKIKRCHQVLRSAEERISVLMKVDEDGTPTVEPVDTEDETAPPPEKKARRRPAKSKSPPSGGDVDDAGGLF